MKIPGTPIRATWKAGWLVELSAILVVLGFLIREIVLAALGIGISLTLTMLAFIFNHQLKALKKSLQVTQHLSSSRVSLGNSLNGELLILNKSNLTAQIITAEAVVEKALRFELSTSFDQPLRPGTTLGAKFTITPLSRGRFQISGFLLTYADGRGLFTGAAKWAQASWIEVYPNPRIAGPLTPLALYGGGPETLLKAQSGSDYAGTREYAPGDDHHRVEWKATARFRTLMVKEFHPEAETTVQILIDAGRAMHQTSYVGTKLDEALAVAQLLVESAVGPINSVGVWVYNENQLTFASKPSMPSEQLTSLRELALKLQTPLGVGESAPNISPPRDLRFSKSVLPETRRVAKFIRLLSVKLGLGRRKTGIYQALMQATPMGSGGFIFVLTDLQTNIEALLEAVTALRDREAKVIVAQIGAAWRLSDDLERAYFEYQKNTSLLLRLQRLGLTVNDVRPERLIEAISQDVNRGSAMTSGPGAQSR